MNYKNSDSIAKSASRYGNEISHEKSKILVDFPDLDKCNNLTISIHGKKLIKSFKYLGVLLTDKANRKT